MAFVGEILREAFLAIENYGAEALAWFTTVFPPEKIKQLRLFAENSASAGLARLDKVFPPEKIKHLRLYAENSGAAGVAWFNRVFPHATPMVIHWFNICKPYLPIAAVLVVLVIFLRSCGGGGGSVKTMKAPGRNTRIPRARFERDPKGYFRDLRANH